MLGGIAIGLGAFDEYSLNALSDSGTLLLHQPQSRQKQARVSEAASAAPGASLKPASRKIRRSCSAFQRRMRC